MEARRAEMSNPATRSLEPRRARLLLLGIPLIATVLLCAMVGLLYLYGEKQAKEREQTSLLTDSLWSAQALQFQLDADEEALSRLALEASRPGASPLSMRAVMSAYLTGNPEVTALVWRADAHAPLRLAMPPDAAPPPAEVMDEVMARIERGTRRLRFTAPRLAPDGGYLVDIVAPLSEGPGAALIATLSLDALLARHLPWWISERYNARLLAAEGHVIAAKPAGVSFDEANAHAIAIGPQLPGAMLYIVQRQPLLADSNLPLLGATAGLALLAMLSFVFAQAHIRRRLDAEMALSREVAFRRAMENSSSVGMRARDRAGRIIYVNPAFCRMVGMAEHELVGLPPPMPYWDPADLEYTRAIHDSVLNGSGQHPEFELRFRRKDGTLFDVLISESPLIDAEGKHIGWMATVFDTTDRKQAAEQAQAQEASLQRTARLVTMGEMASTLAHELNQPLSAIASYATGSLNLVRDGKAAPGQLAEALEKLGLQARRAGQIIRRVHDFVRKSEPNITQCAPARIIRESAEFAEAEARKHGVRLVLDMPQVLPAIAADPILIQQVLLNLIRNGAEAMSQTRRADRVLTLRAQAESEGVSILVEDCGVGVPETLRARLFEPFVSTKPDGMGMGLNICRSIIELHKGRLEVNARAGGGTIFTVFLPLAPALEQDAEVPVASKAVVSSL